MNLTEINRMGVAANKPVVPLKSLILDTRYPIVRAKISNTKYGECVWLELEEVSCFLPKRVTNAFRSQIDKFSSQKYGLVFRGLLPSNNVNFSESPKFEIVELK